MSSDLSLATEIRPVDADTLSLHPQKGRALFRAFVKDADSEAAIHAGLADVMAAGGRIEHGDVRTATHILASEPSPHVLLVDVSGADDAIEALRDLAAVCTPDVRVLVVGDNADLSLYRRLVHGLGVGEYAYKPLTRNNVASLFGPFFTSTADKPAATRGGHIIAVCGARGGVGATTIAVNLALQLEATKRHILLLDLHLHGGTTAMMLGVQPTAGLRLVLEDPDRIDALLVDRMSVVVQGRLRLLSAEEPFTEVPAPTPDGVRRLIDFLRHRFSYIVVDLPMPPRSWTREVMLQVRDCVVVLRPDLVGIRDTEAIRKLAAATSAKSHVITVLNRAGMPGGLKPQLVAEGLGKAPDIIVPDLPHLLPLAANLGKPVSAGDAKLRKAMSPLIQEIVGVDAQTAPVEKRPLLKRLFRR